MSDNRGNDLEASDIVVFVSGVHSLLPCSIYLVAFISLRRPLTHSLSALSLSLSFLQFSVFVSGVQPLRISFISHIVLSLWRAFRFCVSCAVAPCFIDLVYCIEFSFCEFSVFIAGVRSLRQIVCFACHPSLLSSRNGALRKIIFKIRIAIGQPPSANCAPGSSPY